MNRCFQNNKFTGSVDELMTHCTDNTDQLYADFEKQQCIETIMNRESCSHDEAEQLYTEILLSEIKNTLNGLIEDGLVEISGHNAEGEPLYVLTELGKSIQDELKKKD